MFEALHEIGGVLVDGIPEFRLPKQIVREQIEYMRQMGVKVESDVVVGRTVTIDELLEEEGYEAVYIGTGAGLPQFMNIPGENLTGVYSANETVEFLSDGKGWLTAARCVRMELGEPDASGRRRPVPMQGSEFDLPLSVAVIAIGTSANPIVQSTTPGLGTNKRGYIQASEETQRTTRKGVFAGWGYCDRQRDGDSGHGRRTTRSEVNP